MFHPFCIFWHLFLGTILVLSAGNSSPAEKVIVAEGESFVLAINGNVDCSLQHGNGETYKYSKMSNAGTIEKIRPHSREFCGFKVRNVTRYGAGDWRLDGLWADRGKRETLTQSKTAHVEVQQRPPTDECPSNGGGEDHCELWNSKTTGKAECGLAPSSWDEYECRYFASGVMQQQKRKVVKRTPVEETQNPLVQKSSGPTFTDGNSAILECRYKYKSISSCTVEQLASTRRIFNVEEGLAYKDYSAFKSNFHNGICQFEMPSPIRKEDAGLWTMTLKQQGGEKIEEHRCEFTLKSPFAASETSLPHGEQMIIIRTTEEEATIPCAKHLGYPLTRCYLRLTGEADIEFKNDLSRGVCEFKVKPGIWHCGFNKAAENQPDIIRHFEVVRFENEVIEAVANTAESSLSCRHIYRSPLKACIFVSPSGEIHSLPSERFHSNTFQYHPADKLMKNGDCGIKFHNSLEKGEWKCIIQLMTDRDFSETIHVV